MNIPIEVARAQGEHGIKGAVHGIKGASHGAKGAVHGIKGAEHGAKGASHGAKGGRPPRFGRYKPEPVKPSQGRNEACQCGSGRKFKKCCGL